MVDRRDDVLRAPIRALRYSPRDLAVPGGTGGPRASPDGWSQLWILRDGKPTAITVHLGLDDGAYTEIVKGDVQPGDELIIGESTARGTKGHEPAQRNDGTTTDADPAIEVQRSVNSRFERVRGRLRVVSIRPFFLLLTSGSHQPYCLVLFPLSSRQGSGSLNFEALKEG